MSAVDHPAHYQFTPEVIDVVEDMSFNIGNAVKYLARAGVKTPEPEEDLRKAEWYIRREVKRRLADVGDTGCCLDHAKRPIHYELSNAHLVWEDSPGAEVLVRRLEIVIERFEGGDYDPQQA